MLLAQLPAVTACQPGRTAPTGPYAGYARYHKDIVGLFNTVISVIAYCESPADFERLAATAQSRFTQLHALFDIYNAHAGVVNLYTVNQGAGGPPLAVAAEIIGLLTFCRDQAQRVGGKIDITLGAMLELWSQTREAGRDAPEQAVLPDPATLRAAAAHSGWERVVIDPAANTIQITDPDLRLDVGAVAKGYATRVVADELAQAGWDSFLLSNGASSIVLHGRPFQDDKETWSVGIQNPSALLPEPGETADGQPDYLAVAQLTDRAIGNSGDYQNYYTVDGRHYSHLIDPDTLMPAARYRGVSVFTADCAMADLLSSTLFLLPYEEGRAWIDAMPDTDAIWIYTGGRVDMTPGAAAFLTDIHFTAASG